MVDADVEIGEEFVVGFNIAPAFESPIRFSIIYRQTVGAAQDNDLAGFETRRSLAANRERCFAVGDGFVRRCSISPASSSASIAASTFPREYQVGK